MKLVRDQIAHARVARRVFIEESAAWGPGGAKANVARVMREDPGGWAPWGVDVRLCATRAEAVPEVPGPDCVHVRLASRAEIREEVQARAVDAAADDPTFARMNLCFKVREGLCQILVDEERWAGGTDVPGVPLPDYRAYVLHHELGHALGLWSHTSPGRMLRARRAVPALADSRPDAAGALPASIMMQQSHTIPDGFRFCARVGLYDAFTLARVTVLGQAPVF